MTLRAPFPWFGGKSRAAELIWSRLGDCANYVEPYAGSLAVLLGRPTPPGIETVNDADAMLTNFWRAVQRDPETTAAHADWPVNEADLHARHRWLVGQLPAHRERMMQDPEYFDQKIAGWWVWGLSQWIGSGWCTEKEKDNGKRPRLGASGMYAGTGVHRVGLLEQKRPALGGDHAGRGVHAIGTQIPRCNGLGGQGVRRDVRDLHRHPRPMGHRSRGIHYESVTTDGIYSWFTALQERLRRVRVCCGDWTRIMGPSVIYGNGITGIVLDPPYKLSERAKDLYADDATAARCLAGEAQAWAVEHGDDPRLRIVLCGYEGEHEMPVSWECVPWKANGGYGNVSGNENKHRERLWFSPHCLRQQGQQSLWGAA